MPTPTKGRRLGGSAAHQRHLLANLATALFEHGKITTTEAKARRLRPYAERLITFAKRGDLSARREVLTVVTDKGVVHTLFTEIGPQFATRQGGYTRITKIGPRKGDNAPLAVIELVQEEAEAKPRRRRGRRTQSAAAVRLRPRPRRPSRRSLRPRSLRPRSLRTRPLRTRRLRTRRLRTRRLRTRRLRTRRLRTRRLRTRRLRTRAPAEDEAGEDEHGDSSEASQK